MMYNSVFFVFASGFKSLYQTEVKLRRVFINNDLENLEAMFSNGELGYNSVSTGGYSLVLVWRLLATPIIDICLL